MEWDDARIFLALIRAGSVRTAGERLAVSHSTVARRMEALQTRLGVKLFARDRTGYELTSAGADLLCVAESIENQMHALQHRLVGRDQRLDGLIRVTMVDILATHLLMPDIADFQRQYPEIEFHIQDSNDYLDIDRRETDIALRFVDKPHDSLIGRRLCSGAVAPYAAPSYLEAHDVTDKDSGARWVGFEPSDPFPAWVKESDYPHFPVHGVIPSFIGQLEATRQGMGIGNLPCFVGDTDEKLVRLPTTNPLLSFDLWLLRHRDTRTTARLRVFSDFLVKRIKHHAPALAGHVGMAVEPI